MMLLRSMQNTQKKELADAKAENDALRDDVAAGRRRLHVKAVCQSVREATTASGVDSTASPQTQRTPLRTGLFHPQRRLITMQKQLEGTQRSILMSSADGVPLSMGNSCNYCEQYTRFQRSINA